MTTVRMTQMFSPNLPSRILGKDTMEAKLAKVGRADWGLRKKFQSALVSPRKVRKYRAT